jgi:Ca-activated chloride channel family protein
MTRRRLGTIAVAAVIATALAGCFPVFDGGGGTDGGLPNDDQTLRVLAGSEVKDMVPILESAASELGVKVVFDYIGTLEGTELVASGGAEGLYDATWFPNNRYLSLLPGASSAISSSVKIMTSPVVLGLLHQEGLSGARCRPLDLDAFLEDHLQHFLAAFAVHAPSGQVTPPRAMESAN